MVSNIVTRNVVLLLAMLLPAAAQRTAFAQTSDAASPTQPAGPAPAPAAPSTPAPSVSPATTPAGRGNQPLAVNPVTGLTSASAANYHPLTGQERWKLYWKQNYASTGAYFGPVVTALVLDQASNSPAAWGGGLEGYGRRLGSRIATSITQGTIQASIAAGLHEDVRYITSADKGFKRRSLHAIAYSFLTYNSQGHATLNVANLSSYYMATAISTTWMPISVSTARYTFTNGTAQIVLSIPINFLQEFWPEISRKVLRRP
jgi:hypothetical protein